MQLLPAVSDDAVSFCCASLVEAADDKAMAANSDSEGVVGGVWKKSKGEPGGEKQIAPVKQRGEQINGMEEKEDHTAISQF